jgi:hypothetical protein
VGTARIEPNRISSFMVGERGFEPPTPWSRTRANLIDSVSFSSKNAL